MGIVVDQLIAAVISGLVGGVITGIAAWSAIKVEMRYMRRDIDHAHRRIDDLGDKIPLAGAGDLRGRRHAAHADS